MLKADLEEDGELPLKLEAGGFLCADVSSFRVLEKQCTAI
jgi:hypothetical protein